MRRTDAWINPVGIVAAVAIVTGSVGLPAVAQTQPTPTPTTEPTPVPSAVPNVTPSTESSPAPSAAPSPPAAAPASLIGQCRAVNKPTPVYAAASTTSKVLGTLATDSKVTLTDNGSGGFIGVSVGSSNPLRGYVQAANLKPCPPPPSASACRRVIHPVPPPYSGLNIRRDPNITSPVLGGVPYLGTVYLSTVPATSKIDSEKRVWVEIAKPVNGWVSNGFVNGGYSNLGYCP